MTSTTQVWLRGMAAAAIGGLSSAAIAYFAAPQAFNLTADGLVAFSKVILLGALLPTFAYLKQSPLPTLTATVTATKTETVDVTKN